MPKKSTKKIVKRKTIKRKRNPEANVNSLKPFKYYILHLDKGYTFPYYRIIIFKDYGEFKGKPTIIWLDSKNFNIGEDEEEIIEKIWGPFNSLDETMDFGFRLPKGRWI